MQDTVDVPLGKQHIKILACLHRYVEGEIERVKKADTARGRLGDFMRAGMAED